MFEPTRNSSLDSEENLAYIAARMLALSKSWLLAIAVCVAMIASFQGGHAFDYVQAEETECCSSSSPTDGHSDDESHSGHDCCQSSVAVLIRVDWVASLATTASVEANDISFHGGMVKEIDYPPQLV